MRLAALTLLLVIPAFSQDPNRVTIDPGSPFIIVQGTVGDRKVHLLLDTGSTHHVVDTSLRPILIGESRTASGSQGEWESVSHQQISVFNLADRVKRDILLVDFSAFSENAKTRTDGILGYPIWHERVIHFNQDVGYLEIDESSEKTQGTRMHFLRDRFGRPMIILELADVGVMCLLDTGFNASISLKTEGFDRLQELGKLSDVHRIRSMTPKSLSVMRQARVDRAVLGEFQFEDVPVSEGNENRIGMDLLRKFNFAIDFSRDELILSESRVFRDFVAYRGTRFKGTRN